MSEDTNKATRDFVDYKPESIKILSDEDFAVATKYHIILSAMRENIMTVKEIHGLYMNEEEEEKTHRVTQQTIYRYLEEMEKAGLIQVAGYRKTEGVKTSERIFGRTARTFLTIPSTSIQEIKDENERQFLMNLGRLIAVALDLDFEKLNVEAFVKFYEKYVSVRNNSVKNLYEKGKTNQNVMDIFSEMSLQQLNEAMWYVELFVPFIENPGILQELKQLFT